MGHESAKIFEFIRGKVPGDGACLYWSALEVFKQCVTVECNEGLRCLVADWIRIHRELHTAALVSDPRYKTIATYCSAIEAGKLWGGDVELHVLSKIFEIIICVIYVRRTKKKIFLRTAFYGEDDSTASYCVYILHDCNHYDPLYVINKNDKNDRETVFECNNIVIKELLLKYIREKLRSNTQYIRLDPMRSTIVTERSTELNDSNGHEQISGLVLLNTSLKRKAPSERNIDNIAFGNDTNRTSTIRVPNKYFASNKRVKSSKIASDNINRFDCKDMSSMTICQLLQFDMSAGISDQPIDQTAFTNEDSDVSNDNGEQNEEKHMD